MEMKEKMEKNFKRKSNYRKLEESKEKQDCLSRLWAKRNRHRKRLILKRKINEKSKEKSTKKPNQTNLYPETKEI